MSSKPVIAVTLSSAELSWMVHWRQMFDGLIDCGAIPLAIDCGTTALDTAALIEHVDGLLLSGGGDVDPARYGGDCADPTLVSVNPLRDTNEVAAFEAASRRGIPILAICRGAQLVNVTRGGTLYADLARDRPSEVNHRPGEEALLGLAHRIHLDPDSRLTGWTDIAGDVGVNSQHHQGVRDLAAGFTVTAHATDGLIEAYESAEPPLTAIQWHPEMNWSVDDFSRRVLTGFIASCAVGAALLT